ncbi:MAG: hypothetical protein CML22_06920 [Rheinheimera sp.]|nr:hypothetical protein [Rheinheimera sp.]MBM34015.1 hypothetical protein [Rheinheimera sp.]|tara:strand:- start:85 stop:363 length:279 start_codon:yes stop_codon:yes gene_type:complete
MVPTTAHPLYQQLSRYFKCGQVDIPSPAPGKKQFILCPISSGIDSTAVAIVMTVMYPSLPLVFVHTDTGIEVDGTAEAINRIDLYQQQWTLH